MAVPTASAQFPGQTTGQTGAGGAKPICPAEAHIRLPMNTAARQIRTTVYGNCSDPDGLEATAALSYTSPNVLRQFVPWELDAKEGQKITNLTFIPQIGFTGEDFMQYYAIDGTSGQSSNTTDFYIEVVEGLDKATAVWTGTQKPDELNGTGVADEMSGRAGDDVLVSGPGPDDVNGGTGDDVISTGAGNDVINDTTGAITRSVATAAAAKYSNTIDAGAGKDRINSFNRKRDKVKCGKGKDRVTADKSDKLIGCEKVKIRK